MEWNDLAAAARVRGLTLERLEDAGWSDQAVWEFALLVVRELTMRGLLPPHQAADLPNCFTEHGRA